MVSNWAHTISAHGTQCWNHPTEPCGPRARWPSGMGVSAPSARKPRSSLLEAVLSGLCSLSVLTGPQGARPVVPGTVISMCVSPASPQGQSLCLLSEVCQVGRGAAVPGPEGERVGPEAERRSPGIADSRQPGHRISCRSEGVEHCDIGGKLFPAPVGRARRDARVQPWTSGLVGQLVPGLAALWWGLDPCSCPRLQGHLSKELTPQGACFDPAGPCHIQEASSRAVMRTATTGRCSVTRAGVTAGAWTSWAWS